MRLENSDFIPESPELWKYGLKKQSKWLALSMGVCLLVLFFWQTVGGILLGSFFFWLPIDLLNELFQFIGTILAFLMPFVLYARLVGFPLKAIPIRKPNLAITCAATGVSLGVAVFGVLFSFMLAIFFSLFGLNPANLPWEFPNGIVAWGLFILNYTLVPAVVEEFVCRGIILGSLRPYGDGLAVVVSSLIFSLLHRNMIQIPNAFLVGLALGFFMVKTGSIWTGVVIHFINNFLVLCLSVGMELAAASISEDTLLVIELLWYVFYLFFGALGLTYLFGIRRLKIDLYPGEAPITPYDKLSAVFLNIPMILALLAFGVVTFLSFT